MHSWINPITIGTFTLLHTLCMFSPVYSQLLPDRFQATANNGCVKKEWSNFNSTALREDFNIDCDGTGVIVDANGGLILKADRTCWWPGITYKHNDIHYGTATVELTMAAVSGWATAFIRGKEKGDEIDLEWVGPKTDAVETMFYKNGERVKGNYLNKDLRLWDPNAKPMSEEFYRYEIVYLPDRIEYGIENGERRVVYRNEVTAFPEEAKELKLNIWNGGESHSSWAGKTDWSKPAIVHVKYLAFEPYC